MGKKEDQRITTMAEESYRDYELSYRARKLERKHLEKQGRWLDVSRNATRRLTSQADMASKLAYATGAIGLEVLSNDLETISQEIKLAIEMIATVEGLVIRDALRQTEEASANMLHAALAVAGVKDLPEDFPVSYDDKE